MALCVCVCVWLPVPFSPDAFCQHALQLAFYRLHGRFAVTYETAATRRSRPPPPRPTYTLTVARTLTLCVCVSVCACASLCVPYLVCVLG
jgi:hypothetical protein